ncbi:GIY-YIG nuclease family protein [Rhodococcoides yunnanense]|uniref:GIY-YIG nuclease family protein n=1 Tax=Rhodococcoides yunnanense TaxID=278209 RepID=UPI000AF5BD6A|nr:GIY-YIG nuclease family protein [Rhodococcus yunnanensis]
MSSERDEAVRAASVRPNHIAVKSDSVDGVVETDDRIVLQEVGSSHYQNVLDSLGDRVDDEARRIRDKLAELESAIEQNDYRRANIRAGYVYVISNQGAFGPDVVKIGMTRRLDPMDRVKELSSASVPFPFDVHALYFSDDAVALEAALHAAFTERRLNHANLRREFFFATPSQVRIVLAQQVGNLME